MRYADHSIAWLISNLRTNDFAELFDTELASTRMRAGVCISGCLKDGFTVLPPNYRDLSHDPDVVFMAKFVPDSNTGQFLDDCIVLHYKVDLHLPYSPIDDFLFSITV